MKALDRVLQRWRIARVRRWIPAGSRVLDVGCGDGALFRDLAGMRLTGLGLDPRLAGPVEGVGYRLRQGRLPMDLAGEDRFDVVTMLAVMEHIPEREQSAVAGCCAGVLRGGGLVVMTVPSPRVDAIEGGLLRWGLIEGMALEEHYGFDVGRVRPCFEGVGFELVAHRRFQLGLNNVFVFRK